MRGVNKVFLIGRIGVDPKFVRHTNGVNVLSFRMATPDKYKEKSTNKIIDTTEWHNVVCFGALAEICDNIAKKGSLVYLEGRIRTEKVTKNINNEILDFYYTKILADKITVITEKQPPEKNQSDYSYDSDDEAPEF